jgi:hypothetical protein
VTVTLAGYKGNGMVCGCGKHEGLHDMGPGDLAASFKRMSERMPGYMQTHYWEYLNSWEEQHGPVKYEMVQIGLKSGEFVKENKGKPLMAPRIIGDGRTPAGQRQNSKHWSD